MAAAEEETSNSVEAYPMKGGDGPNSYANNSTYQSLFGILFKKLDLQSLKWKIVHCEPPPDPDHSSRGRQNSKLVAEIKLVESSSVLESKKSASVFVV
ncbi:unnamed protein product [Malus baccata var. baccata]